MHDMVLEPQAVRVKPDRATQKDLGLKEDVYRPTHYVLSKIEHPGDFSYRQVRIERDGIDHSALGFRELHGSQNAIKGGCRKVDIAVCHKPLSIQNLRRERLPEQNRSSRPLKANKLGCVTEGPQEASWPEA